MTARRTPRSRSKKRPSRRRTTGKPKAKQAIPSRSQPFRLDPSVRPGDVDLHVAIDPQASPSFRGEVAMEIDSQRNRKKIELHAADLRVSRAYVEDDRGRQPAEIVFHPERQSLELRFASILKKGRLRLVIRFSGRLRRDLCGFYAAEVGDSRYAFTQLEASDARKFFPCFDEPAMKARFALSVTTANEHAVVSNSPPSRVEKHVNGRKTVHFERTPPLSTYLVALAVGDLEVSRTAKAGKTPIRIWHVPGKGKLTAFALLAARETLMRLERYFGMPYPYAKLDLVAVPDFEFGAMENAGAVFFRETLLLTDPRTVTLAEKKRAAEVICHELAHMWFGDLVTMAWWDDLWLNEAFATWMAFWIVDRWKPEWKMWHDFQHYRAPALLLDGLRNTHPIYTTVRTPDEANANFDVITYEKGASVVRMVERYLGEAAFRRGVRRYIKTHRESNAVASDLWRALGEASGERIEPVVRAWIEQPGFPVVTVRKRPSRNKTLLELSQERFTEAPGRGAASAEARWPIPWVGRIGRRTQRHLLTRRTERISLVDPSARLVYGNADEAGFFHVRHGDHEHAELVAHPERLSVAERIGWVGHQWSLARTGRASLASLLDIAEALADDGDPDVLTAVERPLQVLATRAGSGGRPEDEGALRSLDPGALWAAARGTRMGRWHARVPGPPPAAGPSGVHRRRTRKRPGTRRRHGTAVFALPRRPHLARPEPGGHRGRDRRGPRRSATLRASPACLAPGGPRPRKPGGSCWPWPTSRKTNSSIGPSGWSWATKSPPRTSSSC